MSDRIKLTMTRHFLFEVEPCVSFVGKMKNPISRDMLEKALRKLSFREPLITSAVELCENGDAYLVTGVTECSLRELNGDIVQIVSERRAQGFVPTQGLFDFYLINGDSIGIFAHVLAADSKSLAFLACELMAYANGTLVSVEPSTPEIGLGIEDFPEKAITPLTFRLADSLNEKWERRPHSFDIKDAEELKKAYAKNRRKDNFVFAKLDNKEGAVLAKLSQAGQIDFSSLLLTAFWEVYERGLQKKTSVKERKIVITTSIGRKLVHPLPVCAGNHSSRVELSPPKQRVDRIFFARAQLFHKELYLKHINEFHRFAYLTFFMGLDSFLADAQYFSAYCGLKSRQAKHIAKIKGTSSNRLLAFSSINFVQDCWSESDRFSDILALEPFFPEYSMALTVLRSDDGVRMILNYDSGKMTHEGAEKLLGEAVAVLRGMLK